MIQYADLSSYFMRTPTNMVMDWSKRQGRNSFLEVRSTFQPLLMSLPMRRPVLSLSIYLQTTWVLFQTLIRRLLCTGAQIVAPNHKHFTMFPPISYDTWLMETMENRML